MPTLFTTVTRGEKEWEIKVSYRCTYKGCAAQTYGPPERCYPAEAAEFEIDDITETNCNVDEPFEPTMPETEALYQLIEEQYEPEFRDD